MTKVFCDQCKEEAYEPLKAKVCYRKDQQAIFVICTDPEIHFCSTECLDRALVQAIYNAADDTTKENLLQDIDLAERERFCEDGEPQPEPNPDPPHVIHRSGT